MENKRNKKGDGRIRTEAFGVYLTKDEKEFVQNVSNDLGLNRTDAILQCFRIVNDLMKRLKGDDKNEK